MTLRSSKQAIQLAEQIVQFADILILTLLESGHINIGCIAQEEGSVSEALLHFNAALKSSQKYLLAAIRLAQLKFNKSMFCLFVIVTAL